MCGGKPKRLATTGSHVGFCRKFYEGRCEAWKAFELVTGGKIWRQKTHNYFLKQNKVMAPTAATRSKALSLYRKLLRGAMKMPTPNRQNFVIRKTRTEFKASVNLTDPDAINNAIRLADTNLDTVLVQAEHLTKLMKDPNYQVDI